ncbi:MAG: oligogalacturonate lyase family protein [Eubacteriales bacterium]|nr:oligogalacturonate lyase family protein [Eubacteriales bacterium]
MGTPIIMAGDDNYNSQLLYFTSTSLSFDDNKLFYISDKNGNPNIYCKNFITGEDTLLTDNSEGYLKSYVYFDGTDYKGIGKASICLDPYREILYYIQGDELRKVDSSGNITTLALLPKGQVTAFTHVSGDGKKLCVPTTDARALEYDYLKDGRPPYDIDQRVVEENLNSYLNVYDTQTGKQLICEKVNKAWITHVQFHPMDSSIILYNHEWPYVDRGIRRMWLFDGKTHTRLRNPAPDRGRDDWAVHEMWSEKGDSIIYHGSYIDGPAYVGRVDMIDLSLTEIALPDTFKEYGHFTINNNNDLVSDGYFHDGVRKSPAEFISVQKIDWANKNIEWTPLCKHQSSWCSQDAHPHPIFNHKGDRIYYTSDCDGKLKVYSVEV